MIDGQASIHRTSDGRLLRTIDVPVSAPLGIRYAAWHPDGNQVALAWMTTVGLWDVETGRQLAILEGHEGMMTGPGFTDTGQWLISTSWDHTTRLWHTDTHREALRLPDSGNGVRVSADFGSRLAFNSWDGARVHYELGLPAPVQRFSLPQPTRHANHYTAQAAFSSEGDLVATMDKEGVYLFQPPNPTPLAHLPAEAPYTVQFQPDGLALLTSGTNGVCRWPMAWSADHSELSLGPPAILEPTRGQVVNYFELSRDGQWIVVATEKSLLGFDPKQSAEPIRAAAGIQPDTRPHLSSDGLLAATDSRTKSSGIQVWNTRTGMLLTNLPALHPQSAAFSPGGHWLACDAEDATTFWKVKDWSPSRRIPHTPDPSARHHLAFSPDGRVAALSVSDYEIQLLAVETGEELPPCQPATC